MNKTQNKSLTAHTCEHYRLWYSLHYLKMNGRLRPAALWEMQVEILQFGVRMHGWLCINMDDVKPKHCDCRTWSNTRRLACELKQKHKYVLEKESVEV